jgi:hypothetical protein
MSKNEYTPPLKSGQRPLRLVPPITDSSQMTSILSLYIPVMVPVYPKLVFLLELKIKTTLSPNL